MITLYTFGNGFGLPDPSPFVMKTMLLLKLAGLDFQDNRHGFRQAPNGKLPYINDDGEVIADSTFIRFHIEKKYGFDFDAHLNAEQKAASWAFEKMCEDHLYWAMVDMRWLDADNFNKGPATFFAGVPQPIRMIVTQLVQRKVRKKFICTRPRSSVETTNCRIGRARYRRHFNVARRQAVFIWRRAVRSRCQRVWHGVGFIVAAI